MSIAVSGCAEPSFTSSKGLQFSLYCHQDLPGTGHIGNAGADNVEDCLNQCSMHPANACGAAAFDSIARRCYFKDTTVTEATLLPREGYTIGVANRTQYQSLPTTCTSNGANRKAQNGLEFTVYCDQGFIGYDACPDDEPECRAHTESLDECLDVCSTLHPICTGVGWDPLLKSGYLNCFPKNTTARKFDNARYKADDGSQCAKALLEVYPDDCPAAINGTVVASNKNSFQLSCGEDRPGNNITAQHANSLGACVDSCATYTNASCIGAVFDLGMVNGFENCYLKSEVGFTVNQSGFTFALRQANSNASIPDNSNFPQPQRQSSSKAWIAGPVIGAIAVIGMILAGLWWCRSNDRGKEVESIEDDQRQEDGNPNTRPAKHETISELSSSNGASWVAGSELDATNATIYELNTSREPIEMDCTTKGGIVYSMVNSGFHPS